MVSIEVTGLKELIKQVEQLATSRELEEADKKALKRCGDLAKTEVQKIMPKSQDVSKSGRKGSRTFKHAADNIPIKLKKVDGQLTVIVGWEKGSNDAYFYSKFVEFGSSKMPPSAPFKRTFIRERKEWDKIFEEEYNKLLEKLR
ncbi:HK97-gp10 family putative phage morphogenesis protein [Clostridium yunnanense]|nr:HK97-gp10 family putative phage morphogenesis protein [Clostridium yunnanense]